MEFLYLPVVTTGRRSVLWSRLRVPQNKGISEGPSLYRYDSTGRLVHYDSENREIEQESAFTVTSTSHPDAGRQTSSFQSGSTLPCRGT